MDTQYQSDLIGEFQDLIESTNIPNISVHNMTTEQNLEISLDTELQMDSRSVYVFDSAGKLMPLHQNVEVLPSTNNGSINLSPQLPKESLCKMDTLASLLTSWELYDELYIFLQGKQCSIKGLKYMKERHIDELFCGYNNFDVKVIFEHKLGIWQKANGIYNLNPQSSPINESVESRVKEINSPQSMSNASEDDITVKEVLNRTEQGKSLISTYKSGKLLTPGDRTILVHKIVQYFTENNKKLSVKNCENLAQQIINIFPTENLSTYFVEGKNKMPPKGKIYDRYRGQRRSLKRISHSDESVPKKKMKPNADVIEKNNNEEQIRICNELKHNRNWDVVLKQWMETITLRRKMIEKTQDASLQQIFQDWPLYKYSRAQELIDMDYNFLKPKKLFNYSKWESFCSVGLNLFSERIKSNSLKTYLSIFKEKFEQLDIDNINIGFTTLLHGILPPSARLFRGKLKKFTIDDSQNSFTLEVKQAANIDVILNKKREQCLMEKTTLQPLIIIVGEQFYYNAFYVSIDNIKYKMKSYLDCIDFYFKLVYVLNIQYPPQSITIWNFIQRFCFNVEEGNKIPVVQTLIHDLEMQMSYL